MDVGTGVALLGPSAITLKLLGPTADYIGEGVQAWAEARVGNVRRIFAKAETRSLPMCSTARSRLAC